MEEKTIEGLIKDFFCDYDDTTPELLPTEKCFEECCKGDWCKENVPKFKAAIKALIKEKIPEKNNNLEEAKKELEEDSVELNQMIGWDAAIDEITKRVEGM